MSPDVIDLEPVPVCRILWRDGKPLDEIEVVTSRPRGEFRDDYRSTDVSPRDHVHVPHGSAIHGRNRLTQPRARATAPATPSKAIKPRVRRGEGRDKQSGRIEALTPEAILEGFREGLSIGQIAGRYGCAWQTVHDRLWEARKDPEFRAIDAALKVCPECGRPKHQHQPMCILCRRARAVCAVEGCGKRARFKGKCQACYFRAWRAAKVKKP
jgi:hypothetical protein